MKIFFSSRLLNSALLAAIFATAPALAQSSPCNRACLTTALNQYLNAVIAHKPADAKLSAGFRQTENAVVVREGTGMWQSMTGIGPADRRYYDPISGQAGFFGTIREGDKLAITTLRLRVEDGKISEAEWFLAREGDAGMRGFNPDGSPAGNFYDPANLVEHQPTDATLPANQRLSHSELTGITNSYFDGLTTHDGSIIRAHPGCMRLENGLTTTGRSQNGGPPSDCTSGLTNFSAVFVSDRRYPVVDVEKGVVLAIGIFIRTPGNDTRRNVFSEWFGIEDGKIRTVHSSMFYPVPHIPVPNWEPYDGNWAPSPTLAPTAK